MRFLIGKNNVKYFLTKNLKDNLPRFMVFKGEQGLGKKYIMSRITRNLYCKDIENRNCKCLFCNDTSLYPDYKFYKPEGEVFSVDQIRSIIEEANRFPSYSSKKIICLSECDKLTNPAIAALLKSLEEVSAKTYFILLSDSYLIKDTIKSRAIEFSILPLYGEDIDLFLKFENLENIANINTYKLLAMGSPLMLKNLFEDTHITLRNRAYSFLNSLFILDVVDLINFCSILNEEENLYLYLKFLLSVVYEVYLYKQKIITEPLNPIVKELAHKISPSVFKKLLMVIPYFLWVLTTYKCNTAIFLNKFYLDLVWAIK